MNSNHCQTDLTEQIPAYILASGHKSAYGSDRARDRFEGKALIQQVSDSLKPIAKSITVVADKPNKYDDLGFRTIGDHLPGVGPMAGLHSALADFGFGNSKCIQNEERKQGWIVVVSTDLMGLQSSWIKDLMLARRPGSMAVAFQASHWEPFPALFHSELYEIVWHRMTSGKKSLRKLFDRVGAVSVPLPQNWELGYRIKTSEHLKTFLSRAEY